MEEQIITLETAKLAKEKGFDLKIRQHYKGSELIFNGILYNFNNPEEQKQWNIELNSAPTQSLLAKWLREKHNIHIFIKLRSENNYEYYRYKQIDNYLKDNGFKTYEEALEIALQRALESI